MIGIVKQDIVFRCSEGVDFDRCHDAVGHSCAAEGPEEIRVGGVGGSHYAAVCEHDFGGLNEIECQSVSV
jgi:hypothetical protein